MSGTSYLCGHETKNTATGVGAGLLAIWGVAVEKVSHGQNHPKLGDQKCIASGRSSFIGHPSASIF